MTEGDVSDDHRLAGRPPRPGAAVRSTPSDGRRPPGADLDNPPAASEDDVDDQIDAVTRLMGFLRNTD